MYRHRRFRRFRRRARRSGRRTSRVLAPDDRRDRLGAVDRLGAEQRRLPGAHLGDVRVRQQNLEAHHRRRDGVEVQRQPRETRGLHLASFATRGERGTQPFEPLEVRAQGLERHARLVRHRAERELVLLLAGQTDVVLVHGTAHQGPGGGLFLSRPSGRLHHPHPSPRARTSPPRASTRAPTPRGASPRAWARRARSRARDTDSSRTDAPSPRGHL